MSALGDVVGACIRRDGACRHSDTRRVKNLRLSVAVLVQLLQLDGGKLIRIDGMPDDAVIDGVAYHWDSELVHLRVRSTTFDMVPEGHDPPRLELMIFAATPTPVPLEPLR